VRAVFADGDVIFDQLEERFVLAEGLADEEFKGGVGGLEFVAFVSRCLTWSSTWSASGLFPRA